jgi:Histidine phosphatase superfamily (branch 2)
LISRCPFIQEYGTTIAEKRSVGVKICHGLLEKIKFDLGVARTDHDMRYMINMDYSADLPINTMGRRIRTRLYFTSESHLHTVLNVLRFANGENGSEPILSKIGKEIVNSTPELCYLTHIVMRVFEDSRPEMQDDPKRFRVEILFSPGATATPLHLQGTDREFDSSRFDTAPLQMIGREGLTCEELEAFFGKAIMAGRTDNEEYHEGVSLSTMADGAPRSPTKKKKAIDTSIPNELASTQIEDVSGPLINEPRSPSEPDARVEESSPMDIPNSERPNRTKQMSEQAATNTTVERDIPSATKDEDGADDMVEVVQEDRGDEQSNGFDDDDDESVDTLASEVVRKVVARKYFWTTVAVGSFILGASCLLLAMRLTDDSRQRRWSSRRYTR